jgi:DNA polymerase III delta prime subunit
MERDQWVLKYAPTNLQDIVGITDEILNCYTEQGLKNHMSLIGIHGKGKSLTAKNLIKVTGCQSLTINASDERNIDTVRDKIKEFAMTMSTNGKQKIICLNEIDSMNDLAQKALRDVIERHATNTKFIITANYKNKVIAPLLSRCPEIMIEAREEDILKRLKFICSSEKLEYDEDALIYLIKKYTPDIRSMINSLQMMHPKKIIKDRIILDENKVKDLFDLLQTRNFTQARLWCLNCNWDLTEILKQLFKYTLTSNLDGAKKLNVISAIAECDFRMGLSVDREVQMSDGLIKIMKAML